MPDMYFLSFKKDVGNVATGNNKLRIWAGGGGTCAIDHAIFS
jgi:hypothetical protein